MKTLIAIIPVILFASIANAQFFYQSTTAQEGYLRGKASVLRGSGRYLEGVGVYENLHEDARRKYLDNEVKNVQTFWEKKAIYTENTKKPSWAEKEHQKLNNLVIRRELEQRKKSLGIIEPQPAVMYRGRKFDTFDDLRNSPFYEEILIEKEYYRENKRQEEELAEIKRQDAIEFGKMWNNMSHFQKAKYTKMDAEQRMFYKNH